MNRLPRAIARRAAAEEIEYSLTFYLTNNSKVPPTRPQCSLWSIYRDRMSTFFEPSSENVLRTKASGDVCAPGRSIFPQTWATLILGLVTMDKQ